MNNTVHILSPEYKKSVLDRITASWQNRDEMLEDLKYQGITKVAIADLLGFSRKTIERSSCYKRNKNSMGQYFINKAIEIMHGDLEALPDKKKRKRRKNQVKKSEIRVVKGS